jgi:DNA-binding CsgD family transcriptional regulator
MYVVLMVERAIYEGLVRLLPELYSAQTLETLPNHVINLMPRLIRADNYSYNETNFARRSVKVLARPSAAARGTPDALETFTRLMHRHPMVLHNRNTDQRALKMSDLMSQRQFRRLELYDIVYRSAGSEFLMTGGFELSTPGDIVTLAFGRKAFDFSEDERELLNLLRPHLRQAYANADAMTTFERQLECREQSLEAAVNTAVVVVHNLTIKHASPLATRWLLSFFPPAIVPNNKLPDQLRRWVRFWQSSLAGECSDIKACLPLTMESEEARLDIRMLETNRDGEVILLLRREVRDECPELLRSLGLAARESAVLFWISKGKTSLEIAAILSITRRTVDKHVESIHRKLGVETRTAAAAIAWSAIRDS